MGEQPTRDADRLIKLNAIATLAACVNRILCDMSVLIADGRGAQGLRTHCRMCSATATTSPAWLTASIFERERRRPASTSRIS